MDLKCIMLSIIVLSIFWLSWNHVRLLLSSEDMNEIFLLELNNIYISRMFDINSKLLINLFLLTRGHLRYYYYRMILWCLYFAQDEKLPLSWLKDDLKVA